MPVHQFLYRLHATKSMAAVAAGCMLAGSSRPDLYDDVAIE